MKRLVEHSFDFAAYRRQMLENLGALSQAFEEHALDEQAVPSYRHPNPLMAWLFWQRLKHVMDYLEKRSLGRVLDFGCGTGVLFPFLLPRCEQLVAFDIHPEASRVTIKRLGLEEVKLLEQAGDLKALQPGSIDTIIALDVLEHVDNLREICHVFANLLSPEGQILMSGPTESWFYRLGRRWAGFKTHFHERDIYDVEDEIQEIFEVKVIARLYFPIQLFRISVAQWPVTGKVRPHG